MLQVDLGICWVWMTLFEAQSKSTPLFVDCLMALYHLLQALRVLEQRLMKWQSLWTHQDRLAIQNSRAGHPVMWCLSPDSAIVSYIALPGESATFPSLIQVLAAKMDEARFGPDNGHKMPFFVSELPTQVS